MISQEKRCSDHSFEKSKVIVFLAGLWWSQQSKQKAVSAKGSASRVCLHTCFLNIRYTVFAPGNHNHEKLWTTFKICCVGRSNSFTICSCVFSNRQAGKANRLINNKSKVQRSRPRFAISLSTARHCCCGAVRTLSRDLTEMCLFAF